MGIQNIQDAAKIADPAKVGDRLPPAPPPALPGLGPDSVKVQGGAVSSDEDRLASAVSAAKAAQEAAGPAAPVEETAKQQFLRGLFGAAAAGAAGAKDLARSRDNEGFLARIGKNVTHNLTSGHPLAAINRGAFRLAPFVGFLAGAADTQDAIRTLRDPQAHLGHKILASTKALAGLTAVGGMAMLVITGATPFLAFGLTGATVAVGADVLLSRWRTGHW